MQDVFNAIGEFLDEIKSGAGIAAGKFAAVLREVADWADAQQHHLMAVGAAAPGTAPAGLAECRQKLAECQAHVATRTAGGPGQHAMAAQGGRFQDILAVIEKLLALFG